MNKLIVLLKMYSKRTFGINRMRFEKDKEQRKKLTLTFVGFVVLIPFLLISVYGYFYGLGTAFVSMGEPQLIMTFACAASCLIMLITTALRASGTLFGFKDYDTVMSMPISTRTVVFSRLLLLYASNILFMLMVMIPACAAYATLVKADAMFFAASVITLIFLPLIPISIASVIGTLIGVAASRFRRKNGANIVFSILFLIAVMFLSFNSEQIVDDIQRMGKALGEMLYRVYPPARWYTSAVCDGDLTSLLGFIAANIAAFAIFGWLVGIVFSKVNTRLIAGEKRVRTKARTGSQNGIMAALYKKELKQYFASSIYVMNTIAGPVLLLLACGVLVFAGQDKLGEILEVPEIGNMLVNIAPFAVSMMITMSCTTEASISIEGGKLWQIKVLPVEAKAIYSAKLLVSLTLALPTIIIVGTALNIILTMPAITAIMIYIMPASYALFIAMLGLYINLCFPRFDWTNEAQVVKQGTPVFIVILLSMVLTIPLMIGALAWGSKGAQILCAAATVIMLIASLLIWNVLKGKRGKQMFSNL